MEQEQAYLWVAVGEVPDVPLDHKASWAIASLGHIASDAFGKVIVLEEPDSFGRLAISRVCRGRTKPAPMRNRILVEPIKNQCSVAVDPVR